MAPWMQIVLVTVIDFASLLGGIALIAFAIAGVALIQRSAARVDRSNAADQVEGGLRLFTPFARWFGVALIVILTLMAAVVGVSLVAGSLGIVSPPALGP